MTPDRERWAEVLAVHRLHGERAPVVVAEQLGALALAGDRAGIMRWQEIARRLAELMALPIQSQ